MISTYLWDIIFLLLAAVILVPFFQAAKLGAVPGFLIAGIIVGPQGLGLIDKVDEISHLSEIGVVLLLFVIGIELKPSRLWLMRRYVFGLGSLQVILTGLLLGFIGFMFFDIPLRASILVGPALALSSTAFVLQLLSEQKQTTSTYGRSSISVLLMQDLAVVPLLLLIPLLALPELTVGEDIGIALAESVLILIVVVMIGRYLLHPILYRVALSGNSEVFTASAVLIVLGTALATEHAGLSMAMGAFLAGLLISDSFYRHQVLAEIQPFRGLLLGLFFMSMGMLLNLNLLIENPLQSLAIVLLLLALKAVILFILAYFFRLGFNRSTAVALLLAQSGEFAMVLFSLAKQSDLLDEKMFQMLMLVVLLSMIVTPVLAHFANRMLARENQNKAENTEPPPEAPVILAGFGRVGHRIGEILQSSGKPFVALDFNADIVEKERLNNQPVYFGDVQKPEVLKAAGISKARVIVVTLNDPAATERVVANLRRNYPDTTIFARGHSLAECKKLKQLGASVAVSENIEASLELARLTLTDIGIKSDQRDNLLSNFKKTYHAQIHDTDQLDLETETKEQ